MITRIKAIPSLLYQIREDAHKSNIKVKLILASILELPLIPKQNKRI